jgi:hypothetical protein
MVRIMSADQLTMVIAGTCLETPLNVAATDEMIMRAHDEQYLRS